MDDPTDGPRNYLRQALKERDIGMKAASLLLKHGHSYIRDYLEKRTPAYLKEADRELLVREYGLRDDLLRPPKKNITNRSFAPEGSLDIDPEVVRNLINAPENRRFLGLWIGMDAPTKQAALDIMEAVSRIAKASKVS